MRPIAYFALILAPLLAALIYFYLSKRADVSFRKLMIRSYLAGLPGVLILFLAIFLSGELDLNDLRSLKRTIFFALITVGFASELGKFIPLYFYIMKDSSLGKPIQAITLSIMVSLGFSTVALILLFLDPFSILRLYPPTLYAYILVPANIIFAVTMGFFIGMSKMNGTRFLLPLSGLLAATVFHGLLNFCIFTRDFKLLSLYAFGSVIIVFILGIKASMARPENS